MDAHHHGPAGRTDVEHVGVRGGREAAVRLDKPRQPRIHPQPDEWLQWPAVAGGGQAPEFPELPHCSRPGVQVRAVLSPQGDFQIEPLDSHFVGFGQQPKVRANHAVVLNPRLTPRT